MDNTYFGFLDYAVYGTAILVILIGLYGTLVKKSLLKIVISLSVADSGLNLLIVAIGYYKGGTAPIFSPGFLENFKNVSKMVDPVPQALVLTAIVIGFGVTAVALSLVIRLYRHHGTLNIDEIKNLKW
jgi:multisubunit Na+/H+ antiporter MnhC subunit